jgi:hypothetical protein
MFKRLYDEVIRQHGEKYLPLLVDASMTVQEARDLLCYLCWDSPAVSRTTIHVLLNELHAIASDDSLLAGLLGSAEALLCMGDAIANARATLFLSGRITQAPGTGVDALMPVGGLVDAIGSQLVSWHKRYLLLKWATGLANNHAAPHFHQRLLDTQEAQWLHAVDAIQDEVERQIKGAPYASDAQLASLRACFPVLELARDLVQL